MVVLSQRAKRQIRDVLVHTARQFGLQQYRKYDGLIDDALDELERSPLIGRHRPDIHPDAWIYHIARRGHRARHLFLYRIREDVQIGRFLHDSMDIPRHWPKEWVH